MVITRPSETDVVDLVAIAEACRPVIAWYDDFLARPQVGLAPKTLARLDVALDALRSLPRCGGRIGRAIAVVASGGEASSTEHTLAALETLRTTLGIYRGGSRLSSPPTWAAPSARCTVQLTLPGLDVGEAEPQDPS